VVATARARPRPLAVAATHLANRPWRAAGQLRVLQAALAVRAARVVAAPVSDHRALVVDLDVAPP